VGSAMGEGFASPEQHDLRTHAGADRGAHR
jgi:hypothetical protein